MPSCDPAPPRETTAPYLRDDQRVRWPTVLPEQLDDWLPDPVVRTRHRRRAAAAPDELWQAARGVRIGETGTLGRLVRWRMPGTSPQQTFAGLLSEYPFMVLDQGERWSVSGLCGRIWTLNRDYPPLSGPEEFRAWTEPGTVRVVFGHWVEPVGDGRSEILSEARVAPVDRAAELRLRSLWVLVGVFERLIGAESLALAAARAEDRERPGTPAPADDRGET
jgi:hypothetical protein